MRNENLYPAAPPSVVCDAQADTRSHRVEQEITASNKTAFLVVRPVSWEPSKSLMRFWGIDT